MVPKVTFKHVTPNFFKWYALITICIVVVLCVCVVGLRGLWRKKGRLMPRYSARVLQYRGYCSRDGGCEGKRAAARVGGAGNAGRGASPTAGKREEISF